jgi:predicted phage tail protein
MVYTIKISKPLRKYVNNLSSVEIDGDSYFNLYSNLVNLFPDLRNCGFELSTNSIADLWFVVDGKLVPHSELFFLPNKKAEIVLLPVIQGSGEAGEIFMGLALVAIAIVAMQPQFALGAAIELSGAAGLGAVFSTAGIITSIAQGVLGLGVGLVLSGAVGLFSSRESTPQRAQNDSSIRAQNDAFGPLQNTTSTQTAIPLIFGQIRVPGQFIGGRIRTINHDSSTVISVANYI